MRIRVRFDAEEEGLQFALSFGTDVAVVAPKDLQRRYFKQRAAPLSKTHSLEQ